MLLSGEEVAGCLGLGPVGLVAEGHVELGIGIVLGIALLDELVHVGRLVEPGLEGLEIRFAGGELLELAAHGGAVHRGLARGQHIFGVAGAVPAADAGVSGALFDHEGLVALAAGVGAGAETAVARADDQEVGVEGFFDVTFGNFGGLAQPVGRSGVGLIVGDDFHGDLALGLLDALVGGFHDGVGGHGRTGDSVDLSALILHQGIAQILGGELADGRGLTGDVQDHVGDGVGAEGHGDHDGADAGGSGGVGAGGVDALGLIGKGGHTGDGRQGHGGGAGQRALEKIAAGKLFHVLSS